MIKLEIRRAPNRLPNYVNDVSTATCVFCPYGADVKPGDRIVAFDEKTIFGRRQRERLVEVTAVKSFRSTGRIITLNLKIAKEEEIARIAEDSELSMEALFEHRIGAATYIEERPPVVVYFRPYDENDTIGSQFKKRSRHRHQSV
ncbi:MAG TPA: hypothetical protein VKT74_07940 [Gammaproteobacteria bacterium]|nr:hypothetical protein [Gammaproteobacteria bacterium]